ncbi:GmrSD restriction endonuclease domain-containing protein [Helicobacter salomonis]|uniref:GmrSD restriction endonuclease domain-containing protein n=1 Tax=Helicobacter salomonis TaxID=56878 RepID=UPI000CF0F71C|nr:DUF262 domain-containing protein [Helicobacter salomonis]
MTFLEFLDRFAHIEVPMLQRDYAQGRRSQEGVADNFLHALFQVVMDGGKRLHLDLIYGYEDGKIFKLIDGQQRITTLWLLHFLLYRRAEGLDAIKGQLAKFTYHTRESSKEFCEKLLNKSNSFLTDRQPSKTILQGGKFGSKENLRNDPTIKAMICTLDRLYERLCRTKDMESLKNIDVLRDRLNHITFSMIDMGPLKLGEELYIKLNARGKLLSKFENLKAFIEQANISHDLLCAIDNKWSDYFFDSTQPETFDPRSSHFLHYANAFFMLDKLCREKTEQEIEKEIKPILDIKHPIDKLYTPLRQEANLSLLDRVIDALQTWRDLRDLNPIFKSHDFFTNKLEKKEICYFFALLFVLKKHPKVELNQNLRDYFRVVRHLVENDVNIQDRDIPKFFRHLDFVSNAFSSEHIEGGVYTFLTQQFEHFKGGTDKLKPEARKAKLILKGRESKGSEDWEEMLQIASEHPYLVGYVDFLLDFSQKSGQENFEKFKAYTQLTIQILDTFFLESSHDLGVLQRAWLCFGDYSIEVDNKFFGNRHQVGVFRSRNPVFKLFANKTYFRNFLDYLLKASQQDLVERMRSIVRDYIAQREELIKRSWWEQCLLQDEELFKYINANQSKDCGRIKMDGGQVYLLQAINKRSPYVDLLGYAFYKYCQRKRLEGLGGEYEGGQFGERQFVIQNFAVYVEPKGIRLTNTADTNATDTMEEDATALKFIPLNLQNTDVFQEFERAVVQIQKVVHQ